MVADNTSDKNTAIAKPELHADRTWYNSLFTQLLAPLIATRYMWLAIEEINPFDFLKKHDSLVKDGKIPAIGHGPAFKEPSFGRYASRNFAAFGMGATFLGIVGLYSKNTLHDMKEVYKEAVGYELGKKPEDVGYMDLFKSQNAALAVTRSAYTKRTLLRLATAATFFLPWHKFRGFKEVAPKYDANANVGVGAVGVHLFAEGFMREPSFFDIEQKMISNKINHKDVVSGADIQPQDIQSLLLLQARHLNKDYQPYLGASASGQDHIRLTERIAELMNQTYGNIEHKEHANFTVGKFNFLLGFGLLDNFPDSLGFVELANHSVDMHEVKEVSTAIKGGENARASFAKHGIDIQKIAMQTHHTTPAEKALEVPHTGVIKHAEKLMPKTHHEHAHRPEAPGHLAV